ncbi:MAG: hypothetical protein CSA81_10550 [Acidobacteria bacterium]|nr:MAG: hypothetical protein CSA81_10550 [Acidobacteriota bacterium]PIE89919.1 MAG: hypothetical protein CR997_08885 [Acidobacteriota bacterium]
MSYQDAQTKKVCRSKNDKVMCGVCGGLAEYWGVSAFWVRMAALVALVMWFPLSILVYFVCCWLMPKPDLMDMQMEFHAARNVSGGRPEQNKRARNPREMYQTVTNIFNNMESRIQKMEDKVTSREFLLNKKFESLQ